MKTFQLSIASGFGSAGRRQRVGAIIKRQEQQVVAQATVGPVKIDSDGQFAARSHLRPGTQREGALEGPAERRGGGRFFELSGARFASGARRSLVGLLGRWLKSPAGRQELTSAPPEPHRAARAGGKFNGHNNLHLASSPPELWPLCGALGHLFEWPVCCLVGAMCSAAPLIWLQLVASGPGHESEGQSKGSRALHKFEFRTQPPRGALLSLAWPAWPVSGWRRK